MEIIDNNMKTNDKITNTVNEMGLVIIDNFGRVLIENNENYVDIPRIIISNSQNKDELINRKYNAIFNNDCPFFYELSDIDMIIF